MRANSKLSVESRIMFGGGSLESAAKMKAAVKTQQLRVKRAYDKKRRDLKKAGKLVTKNSPSSLYFA